MIYNDYEKSRGRLCQGSFLQLRLPTPVRWCGMRHHRLQVNVSLIPYALSRYSKDLNTTNSRVYWDDIGVDAKIALTTSLNLDLTVRPDFSQVEVDQQVTNLDVMNCFFPKRDNFF